MMIEPEVAIRRAWQALVDRARVAAVGGVAAVVDTSVNAVVGTAATAPASTSASTSASTEIIDDLLRRYAEPHRHFHTAAHIQWVLRHVDHLVAAEPAEPAEVGADGVAAIDRDALIASALFHDAVYDTRPTADQVQLTNEARSAQLAVAQLARLDWAQSRLMAVSRLIEATQTHRAATFAETPAAARATAILLDADLAILGSDPVTYRSYVAAIRAEYDFLDEEHWRAGRASVLQGFLARPQIYVTATMAGECELTARANMSSELAELESR